MLELVLEKKKNLLSIVFRPWSKLIGLKAFPSLPMVKIGITKAQPFSVDIKFCSPAISLLQLGTPLTMLSLLLTEIYVDLK
jgi:hypothetical protein